MPDRVIRATWNDARRAQGIEEKDSIGGAYFDKSAFTSKCVHSIRRQLYEKQLCATYSTGRGACVPDQGESANHALYRSLPPGRNERNHKKA